MIRERWNARRIHLWFGTSIGVFFLVWVGSGLLMIVGPPAPSGQRTGALRPDLTQAVVSPREALARVAAAADEDVVVRRVQILPIGGRTAYLFATKSGDYLIDAESGRPLTITPELARRLAADRLDPGLQADPIEEIHSHDFWYVSGQLPVFRVRFSNSTVAHVSPATGEVQVTDLSRQLFTLLAGGMHTFWPLSVVVGLPVGKWLLWAASFASLILIGSGYWLAFPRWRAWRREKS
ncbi:MAG: PepSY domain-containing protein [Gemmatimonadota bacterium]|nr:MAG: PepSY domain-containing protein [Gemmatimonadota bacterium]